MSHRLLCSLAAGSFGVLSLAPSEANAALVDLSGDLGSNFWIGTAYSPIGAAGAITTPFTWTGPNGTLVGNATATNPTGFAFTLRLTNLVYTTTTAGPSNGGTATDILLVATHGFQVGTAGTFFANHVLSGTWSNAVGNTAQLNTTVDINSAQPAGIQTIFLANTAATTSFVSSSPAVGGNTASPVMTIQMALRLRIDGVGTTTLPGSADVYVDLVPTPGAAVILGLSGLVVIRRRR